MERRRFTVESLLVQINSGPPGRCGFAQLCADGVAVSCKIRFEMSLADGGIFEVELCAELLKASLWCGGCGDEASQKRIHHRGHRVHGGRETRGTAEKRKMAT